MKASNNQEAKANLWGSLAAQLEMQCGDVLSLEEIEMNNNVLDQEEEEEPLPQFRRASNAGVGSTSATAAPPSSQGSGNSSNVMNNNYHSAASAPTSSHAVSTENNNPSEWKAATVASSNLNQFQSNTQLFAQQSPRHLHDNNIMHHPYPDHNVTNSPQFTNNNNPMLPAITTTSTTTKTFILKNWILTKKVDRDIKEATYNAASAMHSAEGKGTMGKFQKEHIVKCVKLAYLLVDKLVQVESKNAANKEKDSSTITTTNGCNNSDTKFAYVPRDITPDGISIIENQVSGEVVDVTFQNLCPSSGGNGAFHWDGNGGKTALNQRNGSTSSATAVSNNSRSNNNNNGKLGSMLGALGNLFYILFTEGESVPTVESVEDYTPASSTSSRKRKVKSSSSNNNNNNGHKQNGRDSKSRKKSREEDAIMDILLNFAMPGDSSDREDDYIIERMKKLNLPLHLCRFVSDLLYSCRVLEAEVEEEINPHHPQDGGRSNPHHHQDSIFTSLSDVHSDLRQMIDFPDAFLYGTVNSRWEIVFGSNHVFGREKEVGLLMDAVRRIESFRNNSEDDGSRTTVQQQQQQQRPKEVVIISGLAGTGKSLLVQDIRKPLQSRGWIFLRCKFEKKVDPEPLSVIALGFDEFFASSTSLCSNEVVSTVKVDAAPGAQQRCCSNVCCPRNICQKLEESIDWNGLTTLSRLMPSLRRILKGVYPDRNLYGGKSLDMNNMRGPNHEHLFITLLYALSQLRPVLFFTDDVSVSCFVHFVISCDFYALTNDSLYLCHLSYNLLEMLRLYY